MATATARHRGGTFLTHRKPESTGTDFNGHMAATSPSDPECSELLRFEAVYAAWRQATDGWLSAEVSLWSEALRSPGSPECRRLGEEAARLRETAREAYLRLVDALLKMASP